MLREIPNELIRENSNLTNRLLLISEKCQEINEENDLLMVTLLIYTVTSFYYVFYTIQIIIFFLKMLHNFLTSSISTEYLYSGNVKAILSASYSDSYGGMSYHSMLDSSQFLFHVQFVFFPLFFYSHFHVFVLRRKLSPQIGITAIEQDELEKQYGPDAICDLRARNPASANPGRNSNGERTKSGDDSTADQK